MTFIFRFSGTFDWSHMYKESREFWIHRIAQEMDFTEELYKHKGKKMDIKWKIVQRYDAYYAIQYNVHFRITMPKTIFVTEDGVQKKMMRGSLRCFTNYDMHGMEEYPQQTPAGYSKVFEYKWLKSIFRKVTWRDRWDLVDDIGMFTVNDFHEMLKQLTEMHAGGFASIWEPG